MNHTAHNPARAAILDAVRMNLAASAPFDEVRAEIHPHAPAIEAPAAAPRSGVDHVGLFRDNLAAVGGVCEIVGDAGQAVELVRDIIGRQNARRIAVSDAALPREIKAAFGDEFEFVEKASKDVLFATDLGITSAQFGVAETGTLVLASDAEFHRLTSLVPPVHVCLLEAGQIRANLGEVLSEMLESGLSPAITFITGPSRTSDIELTLAIGVHGPAELYVVVIDAKE